MKAACPKAISELFGFRDGTVVQRYESAPRTQSLVAASTTGLGEQA